MLGYFCSLVGWFRLKGLSVILSNRTNAHTKSTSLTHPNNPCIKKNFKVHGISSSADVCHVVLLRAVANTQGYLQHRDDPHQHATLFPGTLSTLRRRFHIFSPTSGIPSTSIGIEKILFEAQKLKVSETTQPQKVNRSTK